jgi:hypothetical protein
MDVPRNYSALKAGGSARKPASPRVSFDGPTASPARAASGSASKEHRDLEVDERLERVGAQRQN